MRFRRLYWVTESLSPKGESKVTGVYTSIPDLIRKGLQLCREGSGLQIRLTLVKLDSENEPLGSWSTDNFDGLEASLEEYVRTDEFSEEQCKRLVEELQALRDSKQPA